MQVRDVMRRNPRVTTPGSALSEAGRLMETYRCGVLPVVDDDSGGKVVGMITDRDLCLAVCGRNCKPSEIEVGDVVSGRVHACDPSDDARRALTTMRDHLVRRLPVIENDHLVGILTLDDLMVAARPTPTQDFEGPYYADVANVLKTIAQREQSQVPD